MLQSEGQMAFRYQLQELEAEYRRRVANNPRRTHEENVAIAASLPAIHIEDVAIDDRSCPICLEPFGDPTEDGTRYEEPVRLYCCRNVVGRNCILRMLDIRLATCPYCRSPMDANPRSTPEEEDQWLPTVDYDDLADYEGKEDYGYEGEEDDGYDGYESEGAWTPVEYDLPPRRRSA